MLTTTAMWRILPFFFIVDLLFLRSENAFRPTDVTLLAARSLFGPLGGPGALWESAWVQS